MAHVLAHPDGVASFVLNVSIMHEVSVIFENIIAANIFIIFLAICREPCLHGGRCIAPDRCVCFHGLSGTRCEIDRRTGELEL